MLPRYYHGSDSQSVAYLTSMGIPVGKLLLGFPAYFVSYAGVAGPSASNGLYQGFDQTKTRLLRLTDGTLVWIPDGRAAVDHIYTTQLIVFLVSAARTGRTCPGLQCNSAAAASRTSPVVKMYIRASVRR